jgi:molybdate transport system ATP-binding protein
MHGTDRNDLCLRVSKDLDHFTLDIELSCAAGEMTVIVGPSGAGKSTLLRCVAGLARPDRGRITLGSHVCVDTERTINVPPRERRVGMVTQEFRLFPHMTVLENVVFAHTGGPEPEELLETAGIEYLKERLPHQISGGERQRAVLCRTLAAQPRILLLDEPFSALDIENRVRFRRVLHAVRTTRNVPVLLVTHDLAETSLAVDHVVALNRGRLDDQWLDRQHRLVRQETLNAIPAPGRTKPGGIEMEPATNERSYG